MYNKQPKHKGILCEDLGSIPKIIHDIHTNVWKSKNISGLKYIKSGILNQ